MREEIKKPAADTAELEEKICCRFRDRDLLQTALTHSSYANEYQYGTLCNERLEFLGDSVLGMNVAYELYTRYPDMPEGRMTRLRAELVCEQALFRVAQELDLGKYIRLGKGMEHNGGRTHPSILADAVEAVIAALYLDAGAEKAAEFIRRYILAGLGEEEPLYFTDCKTALQEFVQQESDRTLVYELLDEEGPDHAKTFKVQVLLNGERVGEGTGHSKKEAEQEAAKEALRLFTHGA